MLVLGIDTSNYSISAALFDGKSIKNISRLLPVKEGERGLRQSDAVFHHTKALPLVVKELFEGVEEKPSAIGVTVSPTPREGSYMPCFLCGEGLGSSLGAVNDIPVVRLSHQEGHITAALFSAKRLDLMRSPFLALHVSGGTTESVLCRPSEGERLFAAELMGASLDLKAGQLIDRAGVLMGLDFPCGMELEKLALGCGDDIKVRPFAKDGSISLSGYENKVKEMLSRGESREYVSKYVLTAVMEGIALLIEGTRKKAGDLPLIASGGVMSNMYIQKCLSGRFEDIFFSEPALSRDNGGGAAVYAYLKTCGGKGLL